MDKWFIAFSVFYYRILRYLNITYFIYNKSTNRLEQRNRNPRKRRLLRRALLSIICLYSFCLASIPFVFLVYLSIFAVKWTVFQYTTIAYNVHVCFTIIANISIIIYQVQRRSTSRVLVKLCNKLFEIHEMLTTLTGQRINNVELYIKGLLALKLILIIWFVIMTACNYRLLLNDLFGFPIFELAYMAHYMWLLNVQKTYELLNDFVRRQVEELPPITECTTKCRVRTEPLLRALALNAQTKELLLDFLQRFNWFAKLALLGQLELVKLGNNLLTCAVTACNNCEVTLPKAALHLLNALLLAILNDTLHTEETNFYEMLTIIVTKLSKRDTVCNNCKELLSLVS
uniref:DNA primase n=1 Tax=Zeugodacus cucurbitae TaxID=28588 RepID=A0A0A1WRM6_ZEUCU